MTGRPIKRCNSLIGKGRKLNAILLIILCFCVCVCFPYIHPNSSKQVSENRHSLLPHPTECTYLCRSSNDVASDQASTAVVTVVVKWFPEAWSPEVYYSFAFARCFYLTAKKLRINNEI